jgi:serine/threonine protein kinase
MDVNEMLEDELNFYIVTELLEGGELFDKIIEVGQFTEIKAAHIVHQVVLALNYMHSQNMCHRDLKPENILLESKSDEDMQAKLCDFGFSCFFDPKEGLTLKLGSPLYMAPELLQDSSYNEKVDIWSLGVITYMLLSGKNPFPGRNKNETTRLICQGEIDMKKPAFKLVSDEAKDFVSKCLTRSVKDRPSAAALLKHKWLDSMSKVCHDHDISDEQ